MTLEEFRKLGVANRLYLTQDIVIGDVTFSAGTMVVCQWSGESEARVYHHATRTGFYALPSMITHTKPEGKA